MSSTANRIVVVIVGGAILIGAATAYRRWSTPARAPAPAPSIAPSVVADAAPPAVSAATLPPAPKAEDAGGATIDVDEAPWFVEHTTVERGIGECGGMEATIHPRLRRAGVTRELEAIDSSCPHGSTTSVTEHRAFDFDGDGVTELMLVTETVGAQGVAASSSDIWTLRDQAIVPYGLRDGARAPTFSFAAIVDVDDDGRPDLRSRLDYDLIAYPPCGTGFVVPPMFVLHSLPNGDFSAKDAVAKRLFDEQCSKDPLDAQLRGADDLEELASIIVCARVHGTSADAVKRALEQHCASFTENACDPAIDEDAGRRRACPRWALELAKKPVPLR